MVAEAKLKFNPEAGPSARGRFTVFAEPHPEKTYVIGLDGALGLPDGDFDTAQVLDNDGNQCAVMEGRWGPTEFEKRLIPVLDWYDPFVVGERQVLLPVLRNLYDLGYWLYFHRSEDKRARSERDSLGHHSAAGDLRISTLQRAISPRDAVGTLLPPLITLHDERTHGQLCKFGYRPRSSRVSIEEARDADLSAGAPSGETDDLVSALQMAQMGRLWMAHYERPRKRWADAPGTMGAMLNHDMMDESDDEPVGMLARVGRR